MCETTFKKCIYKALATSINENFECLTERSLLASSFAHAKKCY